MNDFYIKLADFLEVDEVKPSDILANFETWDSLTVLSIIAMIDSDYGVNMNGEDFKEIKTAEDLRNYVIGKKNE
jgi:acyl carrier protein